MATVTTMCFIANRLHVRACYDSATVDGYVMLQTESCVFPCDDLYEPTGPALFIYANWREFQQLIAATVHYADDPAWNGWHTPSLAIRPCWVEDQTARVHYSISDANHDALQLSRADLTESFHIYFVFNGVALVLAMPELRNGGTRALRFRHPIDQRSLFVFASVRLLVAFSVNDQLSVFFTHETRKLVLSAAECAELEQFDLSLRSDSQYDYAREHYYLLRGDETLLCISQRLRHELLPNEQHLLFDDWRLLMQCVSTFLSLQCYVTTLSAFHGGVSLN